MKKYDLIKLVFALGALLIFATPDVQAQIGINADDGIKVGNSTTTTAGNIRFDGADFEGYDGSTWKSFTAGGGGATPWMTSGSDVYYDGGDVGIGLTNPAYALHVLDAGSTPVTIQSGSANTNQLFMFVNGSTATADRSFIGMQTNQFRFGNNRWGNNFDWYATTAAGSGRVVMTLDAEDGNLGLGTAAPSEKLHITGNSGDGILVENANPDVEIQVTGNGTGEFKLVQPGVSFGGGVFALDAGNDVVRIATSATSNSGITMSTGDSTPNFGIGTLPSDEHKVEINVNSSAGATPTAQLNIRENNNADFARLQFSNFGVDEYWHIAARSAPTLSGDSDIRFYFWDDVANSGVNILTIDGDAESVGVGTTDPDLDLHVKQSVSNQGIMVEHQSNTNNWGVGVGVNTFNYKFLFNGSIVADIDDATGAFNALSDRSLKRDIEEMPSVMSKLMALKPSTYKYNADESNTTCYGFIAQEVEEIFPEFVSQLGEGEYKGLAYDNFAVIAVKAIQEQQSVIEAQQAQIDALIKQNQEILDRLND